LTSSKYLPIQGATFVKTATIKIQVCNYG